MIISLNFPKQLSKQFADYFSLKTWLLLPKQSILLYCSQSAQMTQHCLVWPMQHHDLTKLQSGPSLRTNSVPYGIAGLVILTVIMFRIFTSMLMAFPNFQDPTLFRNVRHPSSPTINQIIHYKPNNTRCRVRFDGRGETWWQHWYTQTLQECWLWSWTHSSQYFQVGSTASIRAQVRASITLCRSFYMYSTFAHIFAYVSWLCITPNKKSQTTLSHP